MGRDGQRMKSRDNPFPSTLTKKLPIGDMTMDGSILRTQEYKGCGIHAASYKVGPEWVPEACCWVRTKNGWTRMWINSFARFFETPELTFSSETEADACAFRLARRLIDKTLPDLNSSISRSRSTRSAYLSRILQIARQSLSAYAHRRERKNFG
jgi:hypothetical protein